MFAISVRKSSIAVVASGVVDSSEIVVIKFLSRHYKFFAKDLVDL